MKLEIGTAEASKEMNMFFLYCYIVLFPISVPQFHLAYDLKKDRHQLRYAHGVNLVEKDAEKLLRLFEGYSKINLSCAKHSWEVRQGHIIEKWRSQQKAPLTIYQITSTIKIDSIFRDIFIDNSGDTTGKKLHVRETFIYHSIIKDGNKPQLIYITDIKTGLLEIGIGQKGFTVYRESIPIGWVTPDIKQLLSFLN